MNVFEVKVGRYSTRGNFVEFEKFVAKTTSGENDFRNFIMNKYSPLSVSVSAVILVEINLTETPKEVNQVIEPKVEVKNFIEVDFTAEELDCKAESIALFQLHKEYTNKRAEIIKKMNMNTLSKHHLFKRTELIEDGSDMRDLEKVKFRIHLKGKLTESIKGK
jgi:hypothetical protein